MQFKDNRHKKKRKDLKLFKKRHYKPEKPNPGAAPEESSEDSDNSDDSGDSTCKKSFSRRPIENNWARYVEPEPIEPKRFEDRRRPTAVDSYRKEIPPTERLPPPERDRPRKSQPESESRPNAGQKPQPKRESRQGQPTENPQPQRQSKAQPKPQRQSGSSKQQNKGDAKNEDPKNYSKSDNSHGRSESGKKLEIDSKLSGLQIKGQQKEEECSKTVKSADKLEPIKPVCNPNSKEDLQKWLDDLLDE